MLKSLVISILLVFHPVHVTLTSIDHVHGTDSLKVFVRMYYDDFLLDYSLSGLSGTGEESQSTETFPEDLMNNYINEKVNIIINNKHLKGKLLNLSLENNEISMDLLYTTDKNPRTITVRNLIMTGLYSDQANMTIIRINDFEEGVMLTPVKTEQTFSLK
jgi:ribosomal protein S24E